MIILDYETRSECDLKACGTDVYTAHETTDILCLAMIEKETGACIVFDPAVQDMPQVWVDKLATGCLVVAHNARFDKGIHRVGVELYGFPEIADERWYCSSAQMRVNAIPASLDHACRALGVRNQKSASGNKLIKQLSIPQADGTFNEDPELMKKMQAYCLQDTYTTLDIVNATRLMAETEHQDWLLNERINDRGIGVDIELAELAQAYAEAEKSEINKKLFKMTGGVVERATQHQRIKSYILDQLDLTDENDSDLVGLMTTTDNRLTLDGATRTAIIELIDAGNLDLLDEVEDMIRLLDLASASSIAKFKRMGGMGGDTGRVTGALIYYGASQTGRYSSKGLQLHNMKRDCYEEAEYLAVKGQMARGKELKNVLSTLSKMLRPSLVAKDDHSFVVGDWSGIEARALPWLSDSEGGNAKLELFKQGIDVYVTTAEEIGVAERSVGKVAELALGFGGSSGAFMAMAKAFNVDLPEHQVLRIVKKWRQANKWVVQFWHDVETSAKKAIRAKGTARFTAGRIVYTYAPELMGGTLLCILPDGSLIQYPYARIERDKKGSTITCLKASVNPKKDSKDNWGRVRLWGGLMVENVTQGFCAGLLRDKLRVAEDNGLKTIAHVHDEIILEVKNDVVQRETDLLKKIMETVPEYAQGLPLKAVPVSMPRYGNH